MEVLCAILILGVGMVGLTHGLTTALSSSKESEVQTAAALVAAARIETLRADGYYIDGTDEGEEEQGTTIYRWQQSITSTDLAGLHQVKITVQNGQSEQPVYELQTLLFDPPLERASEQSEAGGKSKEGRRGERRRR